MIDIFKEKLFFLIHDTPDKCTNIPIHELKQKSLLATVFDGDTSGSMISRVPDWIASGIDRLPLPTGLYSEYDGLFLHPTGGGSLSFDTSKASQGVIEEKVQRALDAILSTTASTFQERHFLMWRFWRDELRQSLPEGSFFPADTRMPNHTIWNHTNMVSAIAGCYKLKQANISELDLSPCFLTLQFGPVQSWIAAAKNTRDLWSGSYLLSWLVAHAIRHITNTVGPDSILYPNMHGQPIFDLLHKEELYEKFGRWTSDDMGYDLATDNGALVVPSLPNKFCAIVPASNAVDLAEGAIVDAKAELKRISLCCLGKLEGVKALDVEEWERQVDTFFEVSYSISEWPKELYKTGIDELVNNSADSSLIAEYEYAINTPEKADARVFSSYSKKRPDGSWESTFNKTKDGKLIISSPTFAWSALLKNSERQLASIRNIRPFSQVTTHEGGPKDTLTGKERAILKSTDLQGIQHFDKDNEGDYGAMNLIKRLWPFCYLEEKYNIKTSSSSTQELGDYFAVLHIDGDDMGKWMSGENSPLWEEQLSSRCKSDEHIKNMLLSKKVKKSLTPSFYSQFTEALKDFSVHVVPKIVKLYGGTLVYSGGDDVVALLPAEKAIECAKDINCAFRGESLPEQIGIAENGFCKLADEAFYRIMPGLNLHMSAGIAIAHSKFPLQAVVASARTAEKRAKLSKLGIKRNGIEAGGAVGVNLLKRSGETVTWSARWDEHPERILSVLTATHVPIGFIKKLHEAFSLYLTELKYVTPLNSNLQVPLSAILDTTLENILLTELHYVANKSKIHKHTIECLEWYLLKIFDRVKHTTLSKRTFKPVSAWDFIGPLVTFQFLHQP